MDNVRFMRLKKVIQAADEVGMYLTPTINWATDAFWVRKKVTLETLLTGKLDQVEVYVERVSKLKAFL